MPGREEISLTVTIMSGPEDGRVLCFRYGESGGDGELNPDGEWVITVGRRDDCDICLPFDTQISRLHARLRYHPARGWHLEDGGSRNGTFIGKKRINGAEQVESGGLFRIGRTWLRLEKTDR